MDEQLDLSGAPTPFLVLAGNRGSWSTRAIRRGPGPGPRPVVRRVAFTAPVGFVLAVIGALVLLTVVPELVACRGAVRPRAGPRADDGLIRRRIAWASRSACRVSPPLVGANFA